METIEIFKKILIAVDDTKYSYEAAKYGFNLASKLNANVALVHINQYPIAANLTGDPILGMPAVVVPDMLEVQREEAKKLLTTVKNKFAGDVNVEEYNLEGNVLEEVINISEKINASLIVLGTHSRTGLDYLLSGSISQKIARNSTIPVLIVPLKEE